MLSQTSEYALRAVLHLAMRPQGEPTRLEDIAAAVDVPRNYLSKTLHQLARVGVLVSGRGRYGGFRLAADPAELTIADVIGPFEPSALVRRCLLGQAECSDATACAVHGRWKVVATPVRDFLRRTTIAELLDGGGAAPVGGDRAGG